MPSRTEACRSGEEYCTCVLPAATPRRGMSFSENIFRGPSFLTEASCAARRVKTRLLINLHSMHNFSGFLILNQNFTYEGGAPRT